MEKKVLTVYVSVSDLENRDNPNVLSSEELTAILQKQTRLPSGDLRIILQRVGEIILREVNENGEFLLNSPGEYDLLFKKRELH